MGFDIDNVLDEEGIENLFMGAPSSDNEPQNSEEENKEEETAEVNVDTLFAEPESVGSDEDNKEKEEDTDTSKGDGTSPKNLYSSIAKALKVDSVFPDLDDEIIDKVESAEDFAELINKQVESRLDASQRRIKEALEARIEVPEIQRYEGILNYLDQLTDSAIAANGEEGEKLRTNLIYQDFINRGYSKERAEREVNKSFSSGSDIEDAKEALKSNREYFKSSYERLISDAKKEKEGQAKAQKEKAERLRDSILNDEKVFGDLQISRETRQRVYDSITKPVYTDDSGNRLTAVQRYQQENEIDFMKKVGLLFTLTDGFKNLDKLVRDKVNKEKKKGLRDLEQTLNNTRRNSDGSLDFVSGVGSDPEANIGQGWKLDL